MMAQGTERDTCGIARETHGVGTGNSIVRFVEGTNLQTVRASLASIAEHV